MNINDYINQIIANPLFTIVLVAVILFNTLRIFRDLLKKKVNTVTKKVNKNVNKNVNKAKKRAGYESLENMIDSNPPQSQISNNETNVGNTNNSYIYTHEQMLKNQQMLNNQAFGGNTNSNSYNYNQQQIPNNQIVGGNTNSNSDKYNQQQILNNQIVGGNTNANIYTRLTSLSDGLNKQIQNSIQDLKMNNFQYMKITNGMEWFFNLKLLENVMKIDYNDDSQMMNQLDKIGKIKMAKSALDDVRFIIGISNS